MISVYGGREISGDSKKLRINNIDVAGVISLASDAYYKFSIVDVFAKLYSYLFRGHYNYLYTKLPQLSLYLNFYLLANKT